MAVKYSADIAELKRYTEKEKKRHVYLIIGASICVILFVVNKFYCFLPIPGLFALMASLIFFVVSWLFSKKLKDISAQQESDSGTFASLKKAEDDPAWKRFDSDWDAVMKKARVIRFNNLIHFIIALALLGIALATIRVQKDSSKEHRKDDGLIDITLIQINDVYEIDALDGGKVGGMARVASLRKECMKKNPNTMLVMAGDFLSPSVFINIKQNDVRVNGRQMVDVMNNAGVDLVTFGNHEFDLDHTDLQDCIDASQFDWVASNTFDVHGAFIQRFKKKGKEMRSTFIKSFVDTDGTTATIGFIGVAIESNIKNKYVRYQPANEIVKKLYQQIQDSCDMVVALTHQSMESDIELAKMVPGLAAIIGGHEHNGRDSAIGNVRIAKALANAKDAFVWNFKIDKDAARPAIRLERIKINQTIQKDPQTQVLVSNWMKVAKDGLYQMNINSDEIVLASGTYLEGRDDSVRAVRTNLTKAIMQAMDEAYPGSDVSIFNSGSIRLDDILTTPVTQYDIMRALPYMDTIRLIELKGDHLVRILEAGRNVKNDDGMFLHYSHTLRYEGGKWLLNNAPIVDNKDYKLNISNYILFGKEKAFAFLEEKGFYKSLSPVGKPKTTNHALIDYMKKHKNGLPSVP